MNPNLFRGTIKEFGARFGMEYSVVYPMMRFLEQRGIAKVVALIQTLSSARRSKVYELPVTFTLDLRTPEEIPATKVSEEAPANEALTDDALPSQETGDVSEDVSAIFAD